MSAPRIFVTREIPGLESLARDLPEARIEVHRGADPLSPAELAERCRGARALICTLSDRIDRDFLERVAGELQIVATFAVGYENIDVAAARALGVAVAHTPGVLTDATAEIAVALLLDCARRVSEGDRLVRAGGWTGFSPTFHLGRAVYGKTVGIVGAGRIGRRVAGTLRKGFGCRVLACSRRVHEDWVRDLDAEFVDLGTLLETSDFVSLHCPATPETRGLIGAEALARMRPASVLVNTARGPIVDEAALIEALDAGRPGAAGLDVFVDEPRVPAALRARENVVVLPHIGSATEETRSAMGRLCAEAVGDALNGRPLAHPVPGSH